MPPERCTFHFGQAARQLVCGNQARPKDDHFLAGVSGLQPRASSADPGAAANRSDDGRSHCRSLARLTQACAVIRHGILIPCRITHDPEPAPDDRSLLGLRAASDQQASARLPLMRMRVASLKVVSIRFAVRPTTLATPTNISCHEGAVAALPANPSFARRMRIGKKSLRAASTREPRTELQSLHTRSVSIVPPMAIGNTCSWLGARSLQQKIHSTLSLHWVGQAPGARTPT
jgi:hypothetical protein